MKIVIPHMTDKELKCIKNIAQDAEIVMVKNNKEAKREVKDADALYVYCTPEIIRVARKLRWVHVDYAGVEKYLFPEIVESNITLTNVKGVFSVELADHIMALILAFSRGLPFLLSRQREEVWASSKETHTFKPVELLGQTLLIVGLGGIGMETARRASAFGMHIIAVREKELPKPDVIEYVGKSEEIHKLLPQADWVAICCALTPKTCGLIGRKEFNLMKTSAFIINVARGGIVDTEALLEALKENRIAGAGLDVIDPEPLPHGHPLWKMKNVIITGHTGYISQSFESRQFNVFCDNLRRFISGEALINVVDKHKGY